MRNIDTNVNIKAVGKDWNPFTALYFGSQNSINFEEYEYSGSVAQTVINAITDMGYGEEIIQAFAYGFPEVRINWEDLGLTQEEIDNLVVIPYHAQMGVYSSYCYIQWSIYEIISGVLVKCGEIWVDLDEDLQPDYGYLNTWDNNQAS